MSRSSRHSQSHSRPFSFPFYLDPSPQCFDYIDLPSPMFHVNSSPDPSIRVDEEDSHFQSQEVRLRFKAQKLARRTVEPIKTTKDEESEIKRQRQELYRRIDKMERDVSKKILHTEDVGCEAYFPLLLCFFCLAQSVCRDETSLNALD